MTPKSEEFDFDKALKELRARKPLSGKDGILTTKLLESATGLLCCLIEE